MIKVGITGQSGFIGTHLFNYLRLKENIEKIPFKDEFFQDENKIQNFVSKCDVVVHLAAMNRHENPMVIYKTNIKLVKDLIRACEKTESVPHIIFSSSTQEDRDNLYGKSKKEGRLLLEKWARNNKASFIGMIIPNVFGPFGSPYYNSVIATFCHQLTHKEIPAIHIDGTLNLIYINELLEEFYKLIVDKTDNGIETYRVFHTSTKKVSDILQLLNLYKSEYFEKGRIPDLRTPFELNLFNNFRCYVPYDHFPSMLTKHEDQRGHFVEIVRANTSGQFSFSLTRPGIIRGNHFHLRKAERFTVIKGQALIQLRRIGTEEVIGYVLDGEKPSFVDIPIWYTHNIKNIGKDDLLTLFWINEPYNPDDPDTYFEQVEK